MKLNNKRTFLVGLAFFLITAFWTLYDAIVPLMLVNKFGLNQTWSGIVMALDNVLALFMLPLFGTLSDKTNAKMGRRKIYILIGTIVACVAFLGLSFIDNVQLNKLEAVKYSTETAQATIWDDAVANGDSIANAESSIIYNNSPFKKSNGKDEGTVKVVDYFAYMYYNRVEGEVSNARGAVTYAELTDTEKEEVKAFFTSITGDTTYFYTDGVYHYFDTKAEAQSSQTSSDGKLSNAYSNFVTTARANYAWRTTKKSPLTLVFFMVALLVTLISMATFRSPAVALMPDVTIKPLRSKANAIINLMGTVAGIIATVLTMGVCFNISGVENQIMSYVPIITIVVAVMIAALIAFMIFVKEPEWEEDMRRESEKYGIDESADEEVSSEKRKLSKAEFRSMVFIMLSVAFWFMGYNAVTSKYSLYASNVLHKDYGTTMIIAQMAALAAYIPAGIIASKIGRKKTILAGVALLAVSFLAACFVKSNFMYVIFALAGIGWATINVNSFPMMAELSKGSDIGKYTGLYYFASMFAQTVTPFLSGLIMDYVTHSMSALFPYATVFVCLSFVTMLFVKHGDSKPIKDKVSIEDLVVDD